MKKIRKKILDTSNYKGGKPRALNKIIQIKNGIIFFLVKYKNNTKIAKINILDRHLLKYTWCLRIQDNRDSYLYAQIKRKTKRLHRYILKIENSPKIQVDHKDGNILNNCRNNLRPCTNAQNAKNQKLNITSTSGYKGVSYMASIKKYRAYIVCNYKQINLGCFKNKKDAANAYNNAALKYHGEFARLNII